MQATRREFRSGLLCPHQSTSVKVSAYRARLRKQGLRPIQIWVPDTRQPNFGVEAARQSKLVSQSRLAAEDQSFVDAISELDLS